MVSYQSWVLNARAHPLTVNKTIDCIVEIIGAIRNLTERKELIGANEGWRIIQALVRQLSVPVRKLCIDDRGSLLKGVVVNPMFHQLGGIKGKFRRTTIKWRVPKREWVLGYEDGRRENVVVPETEHEIEIGRLYGVEFLEDGWCRIGIPFDLVSEPIQMDDWLKYKVLQVNSVGYTLKDALKLVADYEGAHTNDLPAFIAVGVNPEDIDKGRNMKYRLTNAVHFGCLSYIQLVTLYTGLYVIRRIQELIEENGYSLNGVDVKELANLLRGVQTDYSVRARLVQNCNEMVFAGKKDAVSNSRTRRPVYHLWSGSKEWDAPVT